MKQFNPTRSHAVMMDEHHEQVLQEFIEEDYL